MENIRIIETKGERGVSEVMGQFKMSNVAMGSSKKNCEKRRSDLATKKTWYSNRGCNG